MDTYVYRVLICFWMSLYVMDTKCVMMLKWCWMILLKFCFNAAGCALTLSKSDGHKASLSITNSIAVLHFRADSGYYWHYKLIYSVKFIILPSFVVNVPFCTCFIASTPTMSKSGVLQILPHSSIIHILSVVS